MVGVEVEKIIRGGYYIKARCQREGWIAHASPVVRETFDYLIAEANHVDKKYSGFLIKRGQLFRSYKEIRDALGWYVGHTFKRYSENQMKHTMKLLRTHLMIDLVNQPRGNLITVLNYDKYQNPKNYESTDESTNESTDDQPPINRPSTAINKNDKNIKNVKNKNIGLAKTPTPQQQAEDFFNNQESQWAVINLMVSRGVHADIAEMELQKFVSYWTERNKSGTKQRWQMEKTFEVKPRLAKWLSNFDKFNKNNNNKQSKGIKL